MRANILQHARVMLHVSCASTPGCGVHAREKKGYANIKGKQRRTEFEARGKPVPTGAYRSLESGCSLSLFLPFPSFFLSLSRSVSSRRKIPGYDFSDGVTQMPRCLVMTLCSLTRYNLNCGVPWETRRGNYSGEIRRDEEDTYRKRALFFSLPFSLFFPRFLAAAAAVSAGLRRVFCRKQKHCQDIRRP